MTSCLHRTLGVLGRRDLGAAERVGGVEILNHQQMLDLGTDMKQIDRVVMPGEAGRQLVLEQILIRHDHSQRRRRNSDILEW
jgi:hypothetical protein